MRVAIHVLNAVLTVAYPLAVWWSLTHFSPRMTGLVVLGLLVPLMALRLWRTKREHMWPVLRLPLGVMALILVGVASNNALYIKAMPVLISVALLVAFGASLRGEMPMVERFARLQDPDLTPVKQEHCRRVTIVWCAFFVFNGASAALLALFAPVSWWATYTGGIAYALMGVLFAGEYIIRKARFREYSRAPHDRLLAKLFPPPRDV
ncbi:MAG: hypothetical protein AB8H86_17850 [Polyangiales bacterium]